MGAVTSASGWLWAVLLAGLTARALAAAFESAVAALGVTRAQALAAAPAVRAGARTLATLVADPERAAGTVRLTEALGLVASGAAAGLLGASAGSLATAAVAALLAALVAAATSAAGRALGAAHPEGVALALAPGMRFLCAPLGSLARGVAVAAAPLARRRGQWGLPRPPLEEMEHWLAEYARRIGTPSDQSTSELIQAVFDFREKVARDVMVPRTDVVAIEADTPVPEIIRVVAEEGHSRLPVFRGNLDQIEGVLHARDLVPLLENPELIRLPDLLRPPHFVPWSKPVDQLLREMQKKRLHMSVVVDEFGGVMGICTIEDVLEEIVGEIRDEDEAESPLVESHADGTFTVRGSAPISEFNRACGIGIPEDHGYETVAGFLNGLAGAIPAVGDRFVWRGWIFTVSEADPRRATRVRVARVKRTGGEEGRRHP